MSDDTGGKGNGADIGAVYTLLTSVAAEVRDHSRILADHSRRFEELEQGQRDLRQTLTEYHSAVLGHGVLISDLEDRVRRIERHLKLPPNAAE